MLVPHIDHAASLRRQTRRPIHVRVAKKREARLHAFLREGLREDVVQVELITHRYHDSRGTTSDTLVMTLPAAALRSGNPGACAHTRALARCCDCQVPEH